MIGYIFITENSANGKKYIGINRSVKFDNKHFGDIDTIQKDLDKFGPDAFSVRMLRAAEDLWLLDYMYEEFLRDYNALNDPSFYNCTKSETPAKKTVRRKKKVEDE